MATPARPYIDNGDFFQQVEHSDRSTLVLDFDSTLRVPAPAQRFAIPAPTVYELLDCISMARRTRLIVATSGDAREVLATLTPPYPEVWGRGGIERVAAGATDAAFVHPFLIHPSWLPPDRFSRLLCNLCSAGPVAYLSADARRSARKGIFVHPEFRLGEGAVSVGAAEELLQFLVDWLRACAGEVC